MKNIIVTGASRGIGYETVVNLLEDNQNHIIAIARKIDRLEKLKEDKKLGERLKVVAFDLLNEDFSALFSVLRPLTHVDVLINNAGMLLNKRFVDLSDEEWMNHFKINVLAPVKLIRFLMPRLGMHGASHVVNIGSMGGFQGSTKFPGLSAYSASKAGLANLTECLAQEINERRFFINCIALGAIQTDMLADAFPGYLAPLNSEEIGKYIADFALNAHKYTNGKVIPISLSTP